MTPTPAEAAEVIAQTVPYVAALFATALLVGLGEVGLIVLGARWRRDRARRVHWLEVLAIAGPLMMIGVILRSVHASRSRIETAIELGDQLTRAHALFVGFEGLVNAVPLGALLLAPVLALAIAAWSLNASTRLKVSMRSCVIASSAFVVLGIAPFLWGAAHYSIGVMKSLASVAGVDPEIRAMMLEKGMEESRTLYFDPAAWAGLIGVGFAVVVASIVLRRAAPPSHSTVWTTACVVCAAVCFLIARRIHTEIDTPWPKGPKGIGLQVTSTQTPDVEGPDNLEPGPVVEVSPRGMTIDGAPVGPEKLLEDLTILRRNFSLLHPNEPINKQLIVLCSWDTPAVHLRTVLRAAEQAQYEHAFFGFGRPFMVSRPLLGNVRRWRWTSAHALLRYAEPDDDAEMVLLKLDDCAKLSDTIVALRRARKWPQLVTE
jgi:hypothetical protein